MLLLSTVVSRSLPALGLLASIAAAPSRAAPIHLEDGVGFLDVDPVSQDGLTAWTVNGTQHVRTQWFWVQVVDAAQPNPETSLDAIPSVASASDASGDGQDDRLDVAFDGGTGTLYQPELHMALASTPIGGATEYVSQLVTDVTIRATAVGLTLRLFQYTDVDLFGSFADDAAAFAAGAFGVTDASGLGSYESSWDVAPSAVEAALYDSILVSLNDGAPTVLSGATSASGDVTLAAMWEIAIPAGEAFTLRQTQTIRMVPEPGVAALVALGLAGLAARRTRRTR